MNHIIIDSVDTRSNNLIQSLNIDDINWKHIDFLTEDQQPDNNTFYLIHHSDGYVVEFANKTTLLANSYVLFYSGGGLSSDIIISKGDKIFFYLGVLNTGEEISAINAIKEIVSILRKEDKTANTITAIKEVLGFDEQEETLTDDIFNAIYEQKDEEAIEKAISERDKYIKRKGKN